MHELYNAFNNSVPFHDFVKLYFCEFLHINNLWILNSTIAFRSIILSNCVGRVYLCAKSKIHSRNESYMMCQSKLVLQC